MQNIHNFVNRQLCEYWSIFPTVASVLDHLLFTVGNGYDFDEQSGMIVDGSGTRIDEYPFLSPVGADGGWQGLLKECYEYEQEWAKRNEEYFPGVLDEVAEKCAKYKIHDVDDSVFTEEALYNDLVSMQALRRTESFGDSYLRPYPLSERYSDIYNLNKNTPRWFLEIANNLCKAWVRFLNERIAENDVWIPHSERPKKEITEEQRRLINEMVAEIRADKDYKPMEKFKELTSDYGDMKWTTKHRDMLEVLVEEMEEGLKNG